MQTPTEPSEMVQEEDPASEEVQREGNAEHLAEVARRAQLELEGTAIGAFYQHEG